MPRISEFFGITIYMYWFDTKRHHTPHIHVKYQGDWSIFNFEGECLAGNIGKRADKLTKEFIKERKVELQCAWAKALKGENLPWIKPIS